MTDYQKIPRPKKIVLVRDTNIFYVDSEGNLRVFEAKKLGQDEIANYILRHLNEVKLWGSAFCWETDDPEDDQLCIGKDTIFELSRYVNFKELLMLVSLLKQRKRLSLQKLRKAVAQAI